MASQSSRASAPAVRVPSQARAIRTRQALFDAAKREFAERGYEGTTAKTIAERAGVGTGTLYQYFTDKDDLLRELARERYGSLMQVLSLEADGIPAGGRGAAARFRELVRGNVSSVLAYHRSDPGLHALLTSRRLADPALDAIAAEVDERLMQRTEALLTSLGFRGDARATAFVLHSALEAAVLNHVTGAAIVSDERLIEALSDAIFHIVFPRSAGRARTPGKGRRS